VQLVWILQIVFDNAAVTAAFARSKHFCNFRYLYLEENPMFQLHVRQPNRIHQFWPFPALPEMSRLVDSVLGESESNGTIWGTPLDLIETDQGLAVRLEAPGMRPEDLSIEIDQKRLVISGEKYDSYDSAASEASDREAVEPEKQSLETPAAKFHHRETRYGRFSRTVTLPDGINTDAIKADYNAGVLVVTLPKIPVEPVKKIQVNAS